MAPGLYLLAWLPSISHINKCNKEKETILVLSIVLVEHTRMVSIMNASPCPLKTLV